MALLLKNGAVFLHIPKTGGTWIGAVLEELDLIEFNFSHTHSDCERTVNFHRYYPMHFIRQTIKHGYYLPQLKKAFKFCFIRHPVKYYESYFKYAWSVEWPRFPGLNIHDKRDTWHPSEPLFDLGDKDFNQFIRNVIEKRPGYVTELYNSFTTGGIDFIGKTENLVEDLIKVLKIMDLKFDEKKVRNFDKINVSKKPRNPIVWNEKLKHEIMKLEYPALVKYKFI